MRFHAYNLHENMRKIIITSIGLLAVIGISSCSKECECTSRGLETDGTLWEYVTNYKQTGGTSCTENAESTGQTITAPDGTQYKTYECVEK